MLGHMYNANILCKVTLHFYFTLLYTYKGIKSIYLVDYLLDIFLYNFEY